MEYTLDICDKIIEALGSSEATENFVEFVDLFAKPERSYNWIDFGKPAKEHEADLIELISYFRNIAENQKPLEPEFQKVLDDNFWDLLSD